MQNGKLEKRPSYLLKFHAVAWLDVLGFSRLRYRDAVEVLRELNAAATQVVNGEAPREILFAFAFADTFVFDSRSPSGFTYTIPSAVEMTRSMQKAMLSRNVLFQGGIASGRARRHTGEPKMILGATPRRAFELAKLHRAIPGVVIDRRSLVLYCRRLHKGHSPAAVFPKKSSLPVLLLHDGCGLVDYLRPPAQPPVSTGYNDSDWNDYMELRSNSRRTLARYARTSSTATRSLLCVRAVRYHNCSVRRAMGTLQRHTSFPCVRAVLTEVSKLLVREEALEGVAQW